MESVDWALIVDLLKTYAWPLVVLILGLSAKPLLEKTLDRVKKLKAGSFEGELIEAKDIPKQLEAPKDPQPDQKALPPPKENAPPQLEPEHPAPAEPDLVAYAPGGAVINSWARLDHTMRREAERLGMLEPEKRGISAGQLIQRLGAANLISREDARRLQELWQIRNQVAHQGSQVSSAAASEFVATIERLIRDIEVYADINRLRRIFKELLIDYTKPEEVRKIRVGRTDLRTAMAYEWTARTDTIMMTVTERDAALLVARGATLKDPTDVPV